MLDRTYTETFTQMLRHYAETPEPGRVVVGVAGGEGGRCRIVWSAVEDFEASSS